MPELCKYCGGLKPKPRPTTVVTAFMCRRCWRLVPAPLKRENTSCFKEWKALGKPTPPPEDLAKRWRENVDECAVFVVKFHAGIKE